MLQQNTGRGFTLIELLVVVLIISILTAVVLPQYQKAVEKSKATQALSLLRSVGQSAATYYLANGQAPQKFNELDIELPASWTGTEKAVDYNMIKDTRSNGEWSLQLYVNSDTGGGVIMIGRLTGKYKGTGFWARNLNASAGTPLAIMCTERHSLGLAFEGANGEYCEKLFGATKVPNTGTDNVVLEYTLK